MTGAERIRALFKIASQIIIKLANENKQLRAKVEYYEKRAKAEKIVDRLIRAGHLSEFQKEAKINELMKDDLKAWEKAASLISTMTSLGETVSPVQADTENELIKALLNS
jgi:polyhydroxyalkanoate synthesis regulator phasin